MRHRYYQRGCAAGNGTKVAKCGSSSANGLNRRDPRMGHETTRSPSRRRRVRADTSSRVAPVRSCTGPGNKGMIPMRKTVVALAVLSAIATFSAASTAGYSGKGKGGTSNAGATGTLSVNQPSPRYGDVVTFTAAVSGVPSNADLLVGLKCYQDSVWVYQLQRSLGSDFPLGGAGVSSGWTSGGATCTADLFYFTYTGRNESGTVTVAQTHFDVTP
jgi:hypothetical protein